MKTGAFCCCSVVTVVCIVKKKKKKIKYISFSYSFLSAFLCQSQIFSTRNCFIQDPSGDCKKMGQWICVAENLQMCKRFAPKAI